MSKRFEPYSRWLQRNFYKITIKHTCEILKEMTAEQAIKFLEKELASAEKEREMEFWRLYYDSKYIRWARRKIKQLQAQIRR